MDEGTRHCLVARNPKRISGDAVLATTMDLSTSLLLAGVSVPNDRMIDGIDLMPLLKDATQQVRGSILLSRGKIIRYTKRALESSFF